MMAANALALIERVVREAVDTVDRLCARTAP
jgi:hypothetical protein